MRIQRDSARNIIRRVFGILGGTGPEELDDAIQLVCEVGRRGEFDLLTEQGIIAFHAFRSRTAAAGQTPHVFAMASLIGGVKYHAIIERVEFSLDAVTLVRGFVGTTLGGSNSAIVAARDARFTRTMTTDLSNLVQVQDGETAVVPPASGIQIWQGRGLANTQLIWKGPQLLRHVDSTPGGTQDQLAFQTATVAGTIAYNFYGYLVPLAGIS